MGAMNLQLLTLAATACSVLAVDVTNSEISATVDDRERKWNLKLPVGLADSSKVPLVVELHGLEGAKDLNEYQGWEPKQKEQGFVLVQPQGVGVPGRTDIDPTKNTVSSSWSAVSNVCCGAAMKENVDDVKFLRAVVEKTLKEQPKVDADRVYFVGHSNGCGMAMRMAAEASDLVTAVACMSLYMGVLPTTSYSPVPILEIHGRQDSTVPYVLPDVFRLPAPADTEGAEDNIKRIGGYNGCDTTPVKTEKELYSTLSYESNCKDGAIARLVTIPTGAQSGHFPFASTAILAEEVPIQTTDIAYDFLVKYGTRGEDPNVGDNAAIAGSPAAWLMTAVLVSVASALF